MESTDTKPPEPKVFSFLALRALIGLVALSIPFVVTAVAGKNLPSISDSYYTEARDWFVGLLFVVSAFLFAYNGRSTAQMVLSKIASIAAACVALFPTTKDSCMPAFENSPANCDPAWIAVMHYVSAGILFVILTIFCFFFFWRETRAVLSNQGPRSSDEGRRHWVYLACTLVMVTSVVALILRSLGYFADIQDFVYWGEAAALVAFGIAWTVSGKWLPGLQQSR